MGFNKYKINCCNNDIKMNRPFCILFIKKNHEKFFINFFTRVIEY